MISIREFHLIQDCFHSRKDRRWDKNRSVKSSYFSFGTTGTEMDRSHLRRSARIFRAVFIRSFWMRSKASSSDSSEWSIESFQLGSSLLFQQTFLFPSRRFRSNHFHRCMLMTIGSSTNRRWWTWRSFRRLFLVFIRWIPVRDVFVGDRFILVVFIDFHVETRLLSAGDMKRRATRAYRALNARPDILLFTNVAGETPASDGNLIDVTDRFEKDSIGEVNFRNPNGTHDMCPTFTVVDLFESTETVGTQDTLNGLRWRKKTSTTKPLTCGKEEQRLTSVSPSRRNRSYLPERKGLRSILDAQPCCTYHRRESHCNWNIRRPSISHTAHLHQSIVLDHRRWLALESEIPFLVDRWVIRILLRSLHADFASSVRDWLVSTRRDP